MTLDLTNDEARALANHLRHALDPGEARTTGAAAGTAAAVAAGPSSEAQPKLPPPPNQRPTAISTGIVDSRPTFRDAGLSIGDKVRH
jgi:hypothetical protein